MAYDEYQRVELTKEEKEEIDNLPKDYYKVKEYSDYDYLASRRLVVSKEWSKKLLTISFAMNIISSLLIIVCVGILLFKPAPKYYGTTPSGVVVPLKQIN